MTSLFPHPPYAEDQTSAHTILYLHIIRAAAMSGSFISLITAPTSLLVHRYRHRTLAGKPFPFTFQSLLPRLLTHSARGLVIGGIAGVVMTWGRMLGREDIEWKDRSWRLLENEGELRTDWWTLGGGVTGAAVGLAAARRGTVPVSASKAILGGAGVGSTAGIGYMIYSYAAWRQPR